MHLSRSLVAVAAFALLAGCGVEESEFDSQGEELEENTAEAEQALYSAKIWFTSGDGVNVRTGPGTGFGIVKWLAEGTAVGIDCQTTGTTVNGTNIWDYLPGHGGYVTDAYVLTGYDGLIPGVPQCGGGGGTTLGSKIVNQARLDIGYNATAANCNKFSNYYGTGCVPWCSDYARYTWLKAGAAYTGSLSASSISFYNYGKTYGTLKSATIANMKPGDAIVWGYSTSWGEHVGIVTEVSGSSFRSIHGNFDHNGDGISSVYETGWQPITYTAGTGAPIIGVISPK